MRDWEDEAFLAEARAWIESHVDVTGEIEQPHVRPWSTVLRVPTSAGDVWFKAAYPGGAHDVAATDALARAFPGLVLAPIAVDLGRAWLLSPDGGERLREVLASERKPDRWSELLPRYARLQQASVPLVDDLLAHGLPDFRLSHLRELSHDLASELGCAPADPARLGSICDELAAIGMPETVQHDDLHDGNVFVRAEGGYAIFDWGDSCATHPFASLVVALRGIAYRLELGDRDPDVERLRETYLGAWAEYGSPDDLARAAGLAIPVGMLCRALSWNRVAAGVAEPAKSEYADGSREWYEEFAAAVETV